MNAKCKVFVSNYPIYMTRLEVSDSFYSFFYNQDDIWSGFVKKSARLSANLFGCLSIVTKSVLVAKRGDINK